MKKESAFSGLEAAIVLIAFVVVAAVFSYVMLGAGFFATQKAQEVTYSGMKQATSNLILDGMIYGSYSSSNGLQKLFFFVKVPEGGETQDLRYVEYLWTVENKAVTTAKSVAPTTKQLNPGSRVKLTLTTPDNYRPKAGEKFVLEIKPKTGASTVVTRTLSDGYNGGVVI
jgi:flagellin FlaB